MSIRSEVVAALDPIFDRRVAADESPPAGLSRPYARVVDEVSEVPQVVGDSRAIAWRRTVQVDVYEWESADRYLADDAVDALDGLRMRAGLRLRVQGRSRLVDPELGGRRTVLTCTVSRLSA